MATKVNKEETVELQDGSKVKVRPLNIKSLRKFMAVVKDFSEAKDDEAGLDLMVDAVQVALKRTEPEKAEDRDYLEDNLDLPAIYKIMNVAGGVDMSGGGDPNLTGTA
jgi:hypothetical protein